MVPASVLQHGVPSKKLGIQARGELIQLAELTRRHAGEAPCKQELGNGHAVLVPTPSAVPTASAEKHNYDDDDQKSCGVHIIAPSGLGGGVERVCSTVAPIAPPLSKSVQVQTVPVCLSRDLARWFRLGCLFQIAHVAPTATCCRLSI